MKQARRAKFGPRRALLLGLGVVFFVQWTALAGTLAADTLAARLGRQHAWGRFRPGSWKVVRVTTETLDPNGAVATSSVTETRTSLENVTDRAVTLKVETTVEVAGKKLEAPSQSVSQGFYGEPADQAPTVKELGAENLVIGGKTYLCQLEQVETISPGGKVVSKIWRCDSTAPYILKKETTTTAPEGNNKEESTIEVVSVGRQRRILARLRGAIELRLVNRNARGRTETQAWHCEDVPGGVVAQESKEFDTADKLVRRSRLELVEYLVK